MSVYIEILAKDNDDNPVTATNDGVCYACIGKSSHNIECIADQLEGAKPVVLKHLNMANNLPSPFNPEWVEILQGAFDTFPQFRTCLSTPEDILKDEVAMFDVENYSLNEVMFCMFYMRWFCNNHTDNTNTSSFSELDYNIERFRAFTSRGKPWWMGFMFMVAPSLGGDYYTSLDMGGRDASCFEFHHMKPETFFRIATGKYEYKFDKQSYHDILCGYKGYVKNIRSLTSHCFTPRNKSMAKVWTDLDKRLRGVQEELDLFGNPIAECGSSVESVDELVEVCADFFEQTFKGWM